jgi:hypothetical protein
LKTWLFIYKKKKDNKSMQLEIEGNPIARPCEVAEAFAQCLTTVFNNVCLRDFPASSWFSNFLPLQPVSDLDVHKTI